MHRAENILLFLSILCGTVWCINRVPDLDFEKRIGKHRQVVFPHFPGKCRVVKHTPLHGSEDIQVLPTGVAFITSGAFAKQEDVGFYMFDFNNSKKGAHKLKIKNLKEIGMFNPLGLSLYQNGKKIYLYATSINPKNTGILKFEFDEKTKSLTYLKTFNNDSTITHPNNLVVVGEDQFYFTNWLSTVFNDMHYDLMYNIKAWNSVCFFNGTHGSPVVTPGLNMANGISASLDGNYIYVSHIGARSINIYQRNEDNSLTPTEQFYLDASPDNNIVDKDGFIWTSAFPNIVDAWSGKALPDMIFPAQILRIQIKNGKVKNVREVLVDDGTKFGMPSIAAPYGRAMLVGTVTKKLYHCQLKAF